MTRIFASILLIALLGSAIGRPSCQCRPASEEDMTHGANLLITYKERTVKKIHGTVTFPTGERANDVVVEVFDISDGDKNLEPQEIARGKRRRAACVTVADGKFCFTDLPSGEYVLRVGTREPAAMNEIHMKVELDRRWWRNWLKSGKGIEFELSLGI